MRVHVIVGSRHDATLEIAEAIGETLRDRGLDTEVIRLQHDGGPEVTFGPDDAVVLGSAIYDGAWTMRAQRFLDDNEERLQGRDVWLFSAGAKHGADGAELDPEMADRVERATVPMGHHLFRSRIDRTRLTFGERFVAERVHLPSGDFRDWDDVRSWAASIADALTNGPDASPPRS